MVENGENVGIKVTNYVEEHPFCNDGNPTFHVYEKRKMAVKRNIVSKIKDDFIDENLLV